MTILRAETLALRLRDLGIATLSQLEEAKQEMASSQERFSAILARRGLLRDPDVGKRLAPQLGSLPQRLESQPAPIAAAGQVPAAMWRSHRLVPLRESEGKVVVATDDPLSVFALDFFGRRCGCPLEAVLLREQDFTPLLNALQQTAEPTAPPRPVPPRRPRPPPSRPPWTARSARLLHARPRRPRLPRHPRRPHPRPLSMMSPLSG